MGLFKRRRNAPEGDTRAPHTPEVVDANAVQKQAGLWKFLPLTDIVNGLLGVLRDPNGKISSKRAGAGALVVSGIAFLEEGNNPAAIICLATAVVLFALTKWDAPQP